MIVVDSSAYFAITLGEPDAAAYVTALALADSRLMLAATYVECALVTIARTGSAMIDRWLELEDVDVVAVDIMQARLAADAFTRFGRGRHPARLNYDDCFAYALAKSKTRRCSTKVRISTRPTCVPRSLRRRKRTARPPWIGRRGLLSAPSRPI